MVSLDVSQRAKLLGIEDRLQVADLLVLLLMLLKDLILNLIELLNTNVCFLENGHEHGLILAH